MVKYFSIVRILQRPNITRDIDNMRRHLNKSGCDIQFIITKEVSDEILHHLHICVMCNDEDIYKFQTYIETHLYKAYVDKIKSIEGVEWKAYVRYMCKDLTPQSKQYIDYLKPKDLTNDFGIYCSAQVDEKVADPFIPEFINNLIDK